MRKPHITFWVVERRTKKIAKDSQGGYIKYTTAEHSNIRIRTKCSSEFLIILHIKF